MSTELSYLKLAVRRNSWRERLTPGTWRAPFRYLLHPWEVNMLPDPEEGGGGYCVSGGRGRVSRWLEEWRKLDWDEFHEAFPEPTRLNYLHSSPPPVPVPWLVAADSDKAHRCPACGSAGGTLRQQEVDGWRIRPWRVYECREMYETDLGFRRGCGQRFARRGLLLPELEGWRAWPRVNSYIRYHVPVRAHIWLHWQLRNMEAWWTWGVQFRLSGRTRKGARHARS